MSIQTPDWVKHAVFYQIFPDRFARSEQKGHLEGLHIKEWGTPPEEQGYQGGDLYGIMERLDYLEDLGITAIYLNPIFASASNHRYHTYDYYEVDPLLGGDEALHQLLEAAHARDIKIVLDGVFNHASRGFWPFHHVLENGGDSPYIDWFIVHGWPLSPYAPDAETPHNYEAWEGLPALPKFNTDNAGVRRYIFDIARHWIEFGIDGWRLDVPNEIDDDAFWQEFRQVVKDANPEAYICGEIWKPAQRWLQGDQFDAVMNYPFLSPVLSFVGAETLREGYEKAHLTFEPMDAATFAKQIERVMNLYDWEVTQAQLNLLDSHDMARALWIVGEDTSALRLAVLFQMTMPGAPCIYYGDEIGLSSADDPYCREAFPWHDEEAWDHDLLVFYQDAAALRHQHEVLRTGTFETIQAGRYVYVFRRQLDGQEAIVVVNAGREPTRAEIELPEAASAEYMPAWPRDAEGTFQGGQQRLSVTVPAREALVLVSEG